jgi:hypothetical protein
MFSAAFAGGFAGDLPGSAGGPEGFAESFAAPFYGRGAQSGGADGFADSFASPFASPFAGRGAAGEVGYIGPVSAQAAMMAGAAVEFAGGALKIGGRVLIGPAGKTYAFVSAQTAATWAEATKASGAGEAATLLSISENRRAAWIAGKRQRLSVIAARVVEAAARQKDSGRQRALLAEADFCLTKWG